MRFTEHFSDDCLCVGREHTHKCPAGSQEDLIQANGLRVSPRAEWVVVGSWGCEGASTPNAHMFRGIGGDGDAIYETALPGQVWAVAVDAWAQGGENMTAFGFSSWSTEAGAAGQVAVFSPAKLL